jgi:Protein of unknown function (DUF4038)/Putative collagen-binding domain of a collagenase
MRKSARTVLLLAVVWSAAGLFPCRAQTLSPLRVSDNGRYLVRRDGSPFFYLADTSWGLFHMDKQDVDLYLNSRAARKFNVIQTTLVPFGAIDRPNAYGDAAFVDNDPAHPNEKYFRYVDYVAGQIEAHGCYMAVLPIWGGSFVNAQKNRLLLDKTKAYNYGKFLGERYRDKPLIWVLGGDWFADGVEDIWRSLAAGLQAGDGGTHLMNYHPTGQQSSSRYFHNDKWLDFNMVQSRHIILNRTYELVAQDYARVPVKPVIESESVYEGITSELLPYGPGVATIQPHDVRRAAYLSVFAGAAGYSYGSHGIWDYRGDAGKKTSLPKYGAPVTFQEALDRPAGKQMQYLLALLESRPMELRVPDQWLIVNDPKTAMKRIQACRASDRSYAFFYTSYGRPVRVRLRDKIHNNITGDKVRAYWYDPRSGAATLIGELDKTKAGDSQADVLRGDVAHTFTPPTRGPGNDWVLVVDDASKNYPPPGQKHR